MLSNASHSGGNLSIRDTNADIWITPAHVDKVARLAFEDVYFQPGRVAKSLRPDFPVALVLGRSILDAFDRLEVLESMSEAVINSRNLGDVRAMGDAVIEELREAFLSCGCSGLEVELDACRGRCGGQNRRRGGCADAQGAFLAELADPDLCKE